MEHKPRGNMASAARSSILAFRQRASLFILNPTHHNSVFVRDANEPEKDTATWRDIYCRHICFIFPHWSRNIESFALVQHASFYGETGCDLVNCFRHKMRRVEQVQNFQ